MNYKELKAHCDKAIEDFPGKASTILMKYYKKEIRLAKRYYDNGRNLFEELTERQDELGNEYVIPMLLGLTEKCLIDEPIKYVQVRPGASGGLDVDSDLAPSAKEKVQNYLKDKYGEDRVLHVGTFTRLGIASAVKDLMRVFKIGDFKSMNAFTKYLESGLTWSENLQILKAEHPAEYKFYLDNKEVLDLTPKFLNKVRGAGVHAGGIVILDRPVYELIPVERVSNRLVTAFPESGSAAVLDEVGIIKFDILGISILDVISEAVNLIDEKMFLIEEQGIRKVVPQSYIDNVIEEF